MLCITMQRGDYFTVGGDTIVQYDRLNGERIHLNIHAPREVPILRGEVLERGGGRRPDCVYEPDSRPVRQIPWDQTKKAALDQLRHTLEEMDNGPEVRRMREMLDRIFPQQQK